jgi:hypothetical protein
MAPEQRANPPRVQAGVGPKIMPLSAVLVLGTAAVFTLGGAIHGSLGISAARTASIEADAEWRASVARNKPILEDLEILGAPQAKLQNIWNDQAGAPTLPISSLGALATANTPASRSSATISRLKSVDARLEILKVAGTSRDAALGAWVNATNSPTGRLSVMLGLAQPAPEK